MRASLALMLVSTIGLAACGPHAAEKKAANEQAAANAAVANGFVPPSGNDVAQPQPLAAYVGKLPSQQVDGVDFFDRTQVHEAIADAIPDLELRRVIGTPQGATTPIFAAGDRVAAWGCEASNCGARNWTVFVDTKTGAGEVCYHDAGTMGGRSRWYADSRPRLHNGSCPSEASQL